MRPEEVTAVVRAYAGQIGFDLVGIADASDAEFDRAPPGHKPAEYLPGARSVVVGGREVIDEILQTTPSSMYWKHYKQVNNWLSDAADLLSRLLRRQGFKAMWFPETDDYRYYDAQRAAGMTAYTPCFSHICAATTAGLGARGRSGMVLTPRFGPRQRWISVITSAQLLPDPKFDEELCLEKIAPGSCNRCVDACRTEQSGALKPWPEEGGVDTLRCTFGALSRKGRCCGVCIRVCPVGR